jgi:hypothetical protein
MTKRCTCSVSQQWKEFRGPKLGMDMPPLKPQPLTETALTGMAPLPIDPVVHGLRAVAHGVVRRESVGFSLKVCLSPDLNAARLIQSNIQNQVLYNL